MGWNFIFAENYLHSFCKEIKTSFAKADWDGYCFLKMGQSRPLFVYFRIFHKTQININWKMCRWCALDSNPGWQDGRRRQIHWAMAAPQRTVIVCSSELYFRQMQRQQIYSFSIETKKHPISFLCSLESWNDCSAKGDLLWWEWTTHRQCPPMSANVHVIKVLLTLCKTM